MRHDTRRSDDADVIRARLRAVLDDARRSGWVPEDDGGQPPAGAPHEDRDDDALASDEGALAQDADASSAADEARSPGAGRHRAPGPALRWDPGRRGARSLWIAGLVAALLVVGWTWLDRPRVEPPVPPPTGAAEPAPPSSPEAGETPATVVVAVVGSVGRPGLVTVPMGSRVADAVAAAGGLLPGTDPAAVNLAAVVTDGEQIDVGAPGAAGPPAAAAGAATGAGAGTGAGGAGGRLDLNTATASDLDALPGIGPVLAERIVAHRSEVGPFRSVDQLDDVPGIGPAIAAELADLVSV